ncbi:hypothetical protein EPA93_43760 [Ktedonosporobacter rubrisoli]|uniref:Uncharacterized protein n=1 Tax=Ktedonosporobacter rubrisoli TaxID=2509675 RepID=A0A4P6K2Z9_KTERU|nr:hypothetical protein EPA93_43760 [Ktedonosporobacter rubrisoli]
MIASTTGSGLALSAGVYVVGSTHATESMAASNDIIPFYAQRQAGIVTPAQDHLHFVAFDQLNTPFLKNTNIVRSRPIPRADASLPARFYLLCQVQDCMR